MRGDFLLPKIAKFGTFSIAESTDKPDIVSIAESTAKPGDDSNAHDPLRFADRNHNDMLDDRCNQGTFMAD